MSKLSSKEDRDKTRASRRSTGGSDVVKLEEGHNFILLLDEQYEEGYTHWVKMGKDKDKKIFKRTCLGGVESKGWDPDNCPLCALALEQFDLKKAAKEAGDDLLAEDYNRKGNELKAGYSAVFKAVKFKGIYEKKKFKDKSGKVKLKKVYVPDYEQYSVGRLPLTWNQMNYLIGLVDGESEWSFEFLESGKDLVNRVLDFVKMKEGDKKYAELKKIVPSKKEASFEVSEGEIPDISDEFELKDDLDKVISMYKGEAEAEEEYEDEELEKKTNRKKKQEADEDEEDEVPF